MTKTKELKLEDFQDREFYGTAEDQFIKAQVRAELQKQDFVTDSLFEGDFTTWVGVYARPKDKPTYLDPWDEEEEAEQDKYRINGMKQDFSEWFEWKIENLKITDWEEEDE